jgi:cysteine-rich repeat protein
MMCGGADTCIDGSTGTGATETVEFDAPTGSLFYIAYDLFGSTASTSDFTLDVTCTPIVCGDGVIGSTEQCDDGNAADGDGCDSMCVVEADSGCTGEPSVCLSYASITETEPNEDGTPSTGGSSINGNDFDATAVTNADANGAITVSTLVSAALTPAGDEDVFAVSNTGSADVTVTLETGAPILGLCPDGDTGIVVREADGTEVDRDDDDGPDACSSLTVTIPAGTTYYVQVVEWGDNDVIAAYELAVTFP